MIEIIQNDGKVIYKGLITDLPLREDYIIAASIELFREKEPCIIYRTHIMKKFYLRLYDILSSAKNNDITYSQLEEYLSNVDLELQNTRIHFINCSI
jgi:hypothetical protein